MPTWGKDTVTKFMYGQVTFHIEGQKSSEDYIKDMEGIAERSQNMAPAMRKAGIYLMGATKRNFKAQGRPKWAPLAPETIKDRQRKGFGAGPILDRTGALRRSLTQPNAKGQIFNVRPRSLQLSSSISYFPFHQKGTATMPQRAMMNIQIQDRAQLSRIFNEFIKKGKV